MPNYATTSTRSAPITLGRGYAFPECLRWHEGRLYFSDVHGERVVALSEDGHEETICEVTGRPAGLGWLPDGRLLLAEMIGRKLWRLDADGLVVHADLSSHIPYQLNDMAVGPQGGAYIGNVGFHHEAGENSRPATLWLATPDGEVRQVAKEMYGPNGAVVTADGRILIVAESSGKRLTAFDIEPDGSLSNRRLWADCGGGIPDGIGLDANGDVWVAIYDGRAICRLQEGKGIVERIGLDRETYACAIGGAAGDRLFVATATAHDWTTCRERRDGRIEVIDLSR